MDFGPFGAAEIVFIALLALVLLGPKRLPQAARSLGQVLTRLRRATTDLRRTLESELEDVEKGSPGVRELADQVRNAGRDLTGLKRDLLGGGAEPPPSARGEEPSPVARVKAELADAGQALKTVGRDVEQAVLGHRNDAAAPPAETDPGGKDAATPTTEGSSGES